MRRRGAGVSGLPALLFLFAAVLAGCAPVYEPSFRLEPPPVSEASRQCLSACADAREACFVPARQLFAQCSEHALLVQDQCRANAQIDYQICQSAYGPEGQICTLAACPRPQCATDALDRCESDYRRCFAACGGTVVEERRCVANCPS